MIDLELIKIHCRIDGDEEDLLLEQYREAAFEALQRDTSRVWYWDEAPSDVKDALMVNQAAVQAMLLLIGHWYRNREAYFSLEYNSVDAYWNLIQPYRVYGL